MRTGLQLQRSQFSLWLCLTNTDFTFVCFQLIFLVFWWFDIFDIFIRNVHSLIKSQVGQTMGALWSFLSRPVQCQPTQSIKNNENNHHKNCQCCPVNCQVTQIVMNSGYQFSELESVSQMSLIMIVFVIVFLIVKIGKVLVMSCFLITMIKYLKGRRFLGLLFVCQKYKSLVPGGYLVVPGSYLVVLIEVGRFFWSGYALPSPKGHKSLGSLTNVERILIVNGARPTKQGTRSPIQLFWTAESN